MKKVTTSTVSYHCHDVYFSHTGHLICLQETLIEIHYSDEKPDNDFLCSFATVVGKNWPSLASLLSLSASDVEEIKRESGRTTTHTEQALQMLRMWSSRTEATYGYLYSKLKTVPLLRV